MFTDSHCHIYSEYYENIDNILKLSSENGINRYINNGCDSKSNKEVLELSKKYMNMFGTLGIHPEFVDLYTLDDISFIEENIVNKKIIAIGEIGLDYYYTKDNKDKQKKLFEMQLAIAEKYKIPVVVHSREATLDTLTILKKYKVRGIIHSFNGSLEIAREYIKMGYLIGVNGVITFKNANIKEVIKEISLDNIVLETDSPYLTPVPFRGQQNNPSHILEIANFVVELKQISLEELSNITNNNLNRLFNI